MTVLNKIKRRLKPYFMHISVDGMRFHNIRLTKSKTHAIGLNKTHIIKIEYARHPAKLNSLQDEAAIIDRLNKQGCVTCPALQSQGTLPTGEHYFIQQRIHPKGAPNMADMLLALIEQQSFGVYQGDFKPENMIFDGNVCYLIDYDQAQVNGRFQHLNNIDYINWIADDFQQRRGHDFFSDPSRNFDKQQMFGLFKDGSLNLGETTLFQNQQTTDTDSGFYHRLHHPKIFIDGARDLTARRSVLDLITFQPGEKILDVGCNLGLLSQYLTDRQCVVTGIDLDENIITAAKITANILGKDITFRAMDIGNAIKLDSYDTVCLFSVLHHVQHMDQAIQIIARNSKRIIIESKLREAGSRPTAFGWKRTNKWKFDEVEELIAFIESQFTGFKFEGNYGQVDRNRYIMSFTNTQ